MTALALCFGDPLGGAWFLLIPSDATLGPAPPALSTIPKQTPPALFIENGKPLTEFDWTKQVKWIVGAAGYVKADAPMLHDWRSAKKLTARVFPLIRQFSFATASEPQLVVDFPFMLDVPYSEYDVAVGLWWADVLRFIIGHNTPIPEETSIAVLAIVNAPLQPLPPYFESVAGTRWQRAKTGIN